MEVPLLAKSSSKESSSLFSSSTPSSSSSAIGVLPDSSPSPSRPPSETSVSLLKIRGNRLASSASILDGSVDPEGAPPPHAPHPSLDQFRATSIAGNDLLSSCLYTAGACAQYSGKMAPISLTLVSFMLYFFRFVYSEVVTAMPVNGGSYNALLNTTSKRFASVAACLSLISYVATAVVSACYAIIYLQGVWPGAEVHVGTIILLAAFAALTLLGVGESAVVAAGMFALHSVTLVILVVWSVIFAAQDGGATFVANLSTPYPDVVDSSASPPTLIAAGGPLTALAFGYAAALLGITGFETAANYVEEMADARTYVATLRNMWWAAGVLNPLISLGAMAVLPMETILANSQSLLSAMAQALGGAPFANFVAIDAFLVLAGSVLTAYVGVMGLIKRMALDRCLPQFLMVTNAARGTPHWVILCFFFLTTSLFLALDPPGGGGGTANVDNLGSVYDIAFLSVMSAFATSAILLKWKRPDLPRLVIASGPTIAVALAFVLSGLALNIIKGPSILLYFALYFGATAAVIAIMFNRILLLKLLLQTTRGLLPYREEVEETTANIAALSLAHQRTEAIRMIHMHGPTGATTRAKAALLRAAALEGDAAAAAAAEAAEGAEASSSSSSAAAAARGGEGLSSISTGASILATRALGRSTSVVIGGGASSVSPLGFSVQVSSASSPPLASTEGGQQQQQQQQHAFSLLGAGKIATTLEEGGGEDGSDVTLALSLTPETVGFPATPRLLRAEYGGGEEWEQQTTATSSSSARHPSTTPSSAVAAIGCRSRLLSYLTNSLCCCLTSRSSPLSGGGGYKSLLVPAQSIVRSISLMSGAPETKHGSSSSSSSGGSDYSNHLITAATATTTPSSGSKRPKLSRVASYLPCCRSCLSSVRTGLSAWAHRHMESILNAPVVFFAKRGDLSILNKALLYIRDNETSARVIFVHVVDDREAIEAMRRAAQGAADQGRAAAEAAGAALAQALPPPPPVVEDLRSCFNLLARAYPKLRLELLILRGSYFSPPVIDYLALTVPISPNMMFMAMPGPRFPHSFASLRGVRVITRQNTKKDF